MSVHAALERFPVVVVESSTRRHLATLEFELPEGFIRLIQADSSRRVLYFLNAWQLHEVEISRADRQALSFALPRARRQLVHLVFETSKARTTFIELLVGLALRSQATDESSASSGTSSAQPAAAGEASSVQSSSSPSSSSSSPPTGSSAGDTTVVALSGSAVGSVVGSVHGEPYELQIRHIESTDRPTWVPDKAAEECQLCKTPFSLIRRRHHCRACGVLVCGRCSQYKAVLPHLGFSEDKPQRVCNRCGDEIMRHRVRGNSFVTAGLTVGADAAQTDGTDERDVYGFRGSGLSEADLELHYKRMEQLQRTWTQEILANESLRDMPRLGELVQRGIPPAYRGELWLTLSGAREKQRFETAMDGDYYYNLLLKADRMHDEFKADEAAGRDSRPEIAAFKECLAVIERDLNRTFPDNVCFADKDSTGIPMLRRLLVAYAVRMERVRYCQSMNFICALLLLFLDEEDAFWLLATLVEDLTCIQYGGDVSDVDPEHREGRTYYHQADLLGARVDAEVLADLLIEHVPKVGAHLRELSVDVSVITVNWLLCLLIRSLPFETNLRILDCFFALGSEALFRASLALFKLNEREILACDEPGELFMMVRDLPKMVAQSDVDAYVALCYNRNKIGDVLARSQHLRDHHFRRLVAIDAKIAADREALILAEEAAKRAKSAAVELKAASITPAMTVTIVESTADESIWHLDARGSRSRSSAVARASVPPPPPPPKRMSIALSVPSPPLTPQRSRQVSQVTVQPLTPATWSVAIEVVDMPSDADTEMFAMAKEAPTLSSSRLRSSNVEPHPPAEEVEPQDLDSAMHRVSVAPGAESRSGSLLAPEELSRQAARDRENTMLQVPASRARSSRFAEMMGVLNHEPADQASKHCGRCHRLLGQHNRVVLALGRLWHANHFVCAGACGRALLGEPYYVVPGDSGRETYCVTDYMQQFGKLCGICGEDIDSGTMLSDAGGHLAVHSRCARCIACNCSAADTSSLHLVPGTTDILCRAHFEDEFARSELMCAHVDCGAPIIGDDSVGIFDRVYHRDCLVCEESGCYTVIPHSELLYFQTQQSKFSQSSRLLCAFHNGDKVCFACDQPFEEADEQVELGSRVYHAACVRCRSCHRHVDVSGDAYIAGGDAYCSKDYLRLFLPPCNACGKPIAKDGVDVLGKKYHRLCVVCAEPGCARELADAQDVFFDEDARVFLCERHQAATIAGECASPLCAAHALAGRPSAVVDGLTFHQDCLRCNDCQLPLEPEHTHLHKAVPFCKEHFERRYQVRCVRCGEAIDPSGKEAFISGEDGDLHFRCFVSGEEEQA